MIHWRDRGESEDRRTCCASAAEVEEVGVSGGRMPDLVLDAGTAEDDRPDVARSSGEMITRGAGTKSLSFSPIQGGNPVKSKKCSIPQK